MPITRERRVSENGVTLSWTSMGCKPRLIVAIWLARVRVRLELYSLKWLAVWGTCNQAKRE